MSQFLVEIFAILGLTRFISVHFSINFSVTFTQLILGLRSLKSSYYSLKTDLRTLRVFKTFLLISSVNSRLNLTNYWLHDLSLLNLGLFSCEGIFSAKNISLITISPFWTSTVIGGWYLIEFFAVICKCLFDLKYNYLKEQ